MAAVLDFTKFNFSTEEIRTVQELVFDDVIESPEIDLMHTVYPGIVYDKEVGFIGKGGLVGVARQGCNPTPQDWNIGTRVVKWEPKSWEILIGQCATDLESTAALYSLKTGVSVFDFTSSDYIAILVEVLSKSIKEFVIRLVWFTDEDAKNFANGGQITDGVDIKYFNILNGLWKQALTQITANSGQRVVISENAGASYAEQELLPENMKDYLQKLTFKANLLVRRDESAKIFCTQSFYDAYALSLQGKDLESMYANMVNGQKTLTFNGVPLMPIPTWDIIITSYMNNGTKLVNPHRALYVSKDVLAVGVDSESSFGDMEIWYNRDTREVKIESIGRVDAKLLNPEMFQLAI